MSSLLQQIRTDLTEAMKAKDAVRQRTLRSAIAAVQEAEVAGAEAESLDDAGVQKVLKAQVKRRLDSIEAYVGAGRADRADDERAEIAVLETYLPADLSDADLEAIVDEAFATGGFSSMKDMGAAMKAVNAVVAGRADGRRVSDLVKSRLA
ncbi:MAG: GatB/YqeY domain-containing protein [Actinomycetota bacterium]